MPLEPIFLMDLDLHGADETITDRLVAVGALSQSKVSGLPVALSDLAGDISAEEARALAAEGVLATDIAAEEARALAAEGVLSGDIAAETAARIAAVAAVQADVDSLTVDTNAAIAAEETRALAAEAALQNNIDGVASDLATASAALSASITAEETRALAAEAALSAAIDAEEARAIAEELSIRVDFAAGDAATLASAEAYTDTKVAALVDSAPALLDTLNELAAALGDDPNFSTTVLSAISSEQTRAEGAESALDGRLDVLEAKQWRQAVILSSVQGTTTLAKPAGAPAIPDNGAEVMVFIDGRKVFYGSQFSVDVGGGGITFPSLRQNQSVEVLYWA